ncbi:Heterochromatin protein 1 [Stylophora pistillata]|uniref:Heterochromatin protein 1 n=1 Tax=Stylophora pistillata TaxID=50429 RepID=A0A2B4RIS9_STYPI|nr:Heterochromatin protein 1 [Stylophora pistillata]
MVFRSKRNNKDSNDRIDALEIEIGYARNDIYDIQFRLNANEQYSRRDTLEIQGIPDIADDNPTQLVIETARLTDVELEPNDISIAHRLLLKNGQSQCKIIVKFTRRTKRDEVFNACKKLKSKRTKVNKHAPMKLASRAKQKQMNKPWITKDILKFIKFKQKMYRSHLLRCHIEKVSRMTPIFKNGSACDPGNYRLKVSKETVVLHRWGPSAGEGKGDEIPVDYRLVTNDSHLGGLKRKLSRRDFADDINISHSHCGSQKAQLDKKHSLGPIQLLKTTFETTMLKRARHPPGFYASLFEEPRDRGCNLKYRPRSKPITLGVYQVERIVPKRIQGGKCEFFVQWKDYSAAENTWEPSEHIPEELIAAFESRCVDSVRIDECKERLALVFERGLKSPLGCNETIIMRHDVLRSIFPGLPSDLRSTSYLVNKEELLTAGFGSYLERILTVTGG